MTNKEILEKINKSRNVVIVGAGIVGLYLKDLITNEKGDVEIFLCDNSAKVREDVSKRTGISVYTLEDTFKENPGASYIITSGPYREILEKQLIDIGVKPERIIFGVTDEAYSFLVNARKESNDKFTPMKKIQFEVDITGHCNLNCKCCSQFSCLCKSEYIDLREMRRDFERMGKLFGGECERIYLIGGEPLLHPDISECMQIAREYFPVGHIYVFTNGLLIHKQEESFWKSCREHDISVIMTKYPVRFDYKTVEKALRDNKVKFEYFGKSEDFKYMTNLGLDINGAQNADEAYARCTEANNCVKLRRGRLYTCTRPAVIHRFNSFFGTDLKVTESDSIDIYEVISAEDILKRLAMPIPFCRYCVREKDRKAMEWGVSEKAMDEWVQS